MAKNLLKVLLLCTCVMLQSANGFTYKKIYRNIEICGSNNGHRRYLELGESGEVMAHNITVPDVISIIYLIIWKFKIKKIIKKKFIHNDDAKNDGNFPMTLVNF